MNHEPKYVSIES